jgi:hypothetical protein
MRKAAETYGQDSSSIRDCIRHRSPALLTHKQPGTRRTLPHRLPRGLSPYLHQQGVFVVDAHDGARLALQRLHLGVTQLCPAHTHTHIRRHHRHRQANVVEQRPEGRSGDRVTVVGRVGGARPAGGWVWAASLTLVELGECPLDLAGLGVLAPVREDRLRHLLLLRSAHHPAAQEAGRGQDSTQQPKRWVG